MLTGPIKEFKEASKVSLIQLDTTLAVTPKKGEEAPQQAHQPQHT